MFIKILLFILISIIAILIAGVMLLCLIFPPPLSKDATEKDFMKNKDNIMIVTDYLANLKYNHISIKTTDKSGIMFAGLENGMTAIDDSKVISAVNKLFKKRYSVIIKDENTIHFLRSTRFREFSSGIAYSINGTEPQLQFLTKLEPLSEKNWYYYEEDFNEWKRRNE